MVKTLASQVSLIGRSHKVTRKNLKMKIGTVKLSKLKYPFLLLCFSLVAFNSALGEKISKQEKALNFLRGQISSYGLIDSYVEDNVNNSYTYDNALAAMAFISAKDFNSAKKILDAFVSIGPKPDEGGFVECYNSRNGEFKGTPSVGPNVYLIQAMNLYFLKTADPRYNATARTIADYVLSLQDTDGGIFGAKGVTWKSTENNLGALSAIHNLGKVQNLDSYLEKAALIGSFLKKECWDGTRFLTGENDPMIVTDVQTLGALVLGRSYKNGIYWLQQKTRTTKPCTDKIKMTGFDFNSDIDTIWTEGTLQATLAFFAVGDKKNYKFYKAEAEKTFQPQGSLLLSTNRGTTGFSWTLERWQASAPTAWYVFVSNLDNVLALLP